MSGPTLLHVIAEPAPCVEMACPGPCCDLNEVPLTEDDVARLVRATGQAEETFVETADGWLLLKGAGSVTGSCVFKGRVETETYTGTGCTVHTARPQACRTYPFVLADDGRATRDPHCSYPARFTIPADIRTALQRLDDTLGRERQARAST